MKKIKYYYNKENNTYMVMEPFTGSKLGFVVDLPVKFGNRIKANSFLKLLENLLHPDKFLFVLDVIMYVKVFNEEYKFVVTHLKQHEYVTKEILKVLKDNKKANIIDRFIIRCAINSVKHEIFN